MGPHTTSGRIATRRFGEAFPSEWGSGDGSPARDKSSARKERKVDRFRALRPSEPLLGRGADGWLWNGVSAYFARADICTVGAAEVVEPLAIGNGVAVLVAFASQVAQPFLCFPA